MAVAALAAGTLVPTPDTEPEIQLLEAEWDAAAPLTVNNGLGIIEYSIATDDTNEAEATAVIQNADLEVSQATDEFSKVEYGENPYEGTTLEEYYTPPVVEEPSAEDTALVAALTDAEAKLATVESLIASTDVVDTAAVDQANAELNASLESAETLIEAAAADATAEQIAALEEADDALNGAVAAVTDVIDEDQTWISDLAGWTPNIRYAVDRRGPRRALSGDGIDIAIIDSGVTPVQGLDGADKVVNGPDLSSDGQDPATSNIDLFGHGTHLAGIIAGNDGGAPIDGVPFFTGIAPDARLVNVKVANGDGETSIAQIVAGIEWVIANKQANGMNIRVLTLAFGYDWAGDIPDPLAVAVEEAWSQGIVVVISAGNRGNDSAGLDHPAVNPYVIAVSGSDHGDPLLPSDDIIADWSSSGDGVRNPDVAAPGRSIVSLRAPGSHADLNYPESHVGDRFAVASGTSQAAAVASGTIALLLDAAPSLTPDQVKSLLMDTARSIETGETLDGDGRVRLERALFRGRIWGAGPAIQQFHARPVLPPPGFGTLNAELAGAGWAGGSWSGAGWAGGSWSGAGWAGAGWAGAGWAGGSWAGAGWAGGSWAGAGWAGGSWAGAGWAGGSWSGAGWA
jgi:serine protease AprX